MRAGVEELLPPCVVPHLNGSSRVEVQCTINSSLLYFHFTGHKELLSSAVTGIFVDAELTLVILQVSWSK